MSTATATTTPTLTAELHDEVISHLIETGGPRAVEDLKARLADVEQRMRAFGGVYASDSRSWPLREYLPKIQAEVRLARTYRARLADMARLGGPELVDVPTDAQGVGSEIDELYGVMLARGGQKLVDDLTGQLPKMLATLRAELGKVVAEIGVMRDRHGSGTFNFAGPTGFAHDGAYDRLAMLVATRQDLEAKIARVEGDQSKATAVQAAAVAKVIANAGGPSAVAAAVRDARLLKGSWWGSHPDHAATVEQQRVLAGIDGQLGKLGGPDAQGAVADALRADRQAAAKDVESKASEVDGQLRAGVDATVAAAIAGDEPARASLEADARAEPRAFPAGFADALNAAMFPRSQVGSSLLATVLSTGLPLAG